MNFYHFSLAIVSLFEEKQRMEVTLTSEQKQVDGMIDARIQRISRSAYLRANQLVNGRMRKKHVQYTLPAEVDGLLALRQKLYAGENAEGIAATITSGGLKEKFLKS